MCVMQIPLYCRANIFPEYTRRRLDFYASSADISQNIPGLIERARAFIYTRTLVPLNPFFFIALLIRRSCKCYEGSNKPVLSSESLSLSDK